MSSTLNSRFFSFRVSTNGETVDITMDTVKQHVGGVHTADFVGEESKCRK